MVRPNTCTLLLMHPVLVHLQLLDRVGMLLETQAGNLPLWCRGRNAAGLRYPEYWQGKLAPLPTGEAGGEDSRGDLWDSWRAGADLCGSPYRGVRRGAARQGGGADGFGRDLATAALFSPRFPPLCHQLHPILADAIFFAVSWYLERVSAAVEAAAAASGGGPLTLLCHSAGGWLGRVWMLQHLETTGAPVDCYVSLGSPQLPPPPGAIDQVSRGQVLTLLLLPRLPSRGGARRRLAGGFDGRWADSLSVWLHVMQTRGILTWCAENCPGGLHPGTLAVLPTSGSRLLLSTESAVREWL